MTLPTFTSNLCMVLQHKVLWLPYMVSGQAANPGVTGLPEGPPPKPPPSHYNLKLKDTSMKNLYYLLLNVTTCMGIAKLLLDCA